MPTSAQLADLDAKFDSGTKLRTFQSIPAFPVPEGAVRVRAAVRRLEAREPQPSHWGVAPPQLRLDGHERGPYPLASADELRLVKSELKGELKAAELHDDLKAAELQGDLEPAELQGALKAAKLQDDLKAAELQGALKAAKLKNAELQDALEAAELQGEPKAAELQDELNADELDLGAQSSPGNGAFSEPAASRSLRVKQATDSDPANLISRRINSYLMMDEYLSVGITPSHISSARTLA